MIQHLTTVALIFFAAGINGPSAAASDSKQFAILSATTGEVSLKGFKTAANATVMPGDVIGTGNESTAKLILGRYSTTTILSDSQVSLGNTGDSEIDLRHGSVVIEDASRKAVRVQVPGAYVLIKGDRGAAALCGIEARGTSSKVTLGTGSAEIHGAGAPVILRPGQYAMLAEPGRPSGWPQDSGATPIPAKAPSAGGGQVAGSVTREIPRGSLLRGGQTLPLNQNDPVMWNDSIHTLDSGRLQVTLVDGSVLSVGSRSQMTIVKHDPDTQQTSIEMAAGKLRADVAHITKSGGKFEVRTKTAVIGVVGTSFLVNAQDTRTGVCGVEGVTDVTNSQGTPQTVQLHKGECTIVGLGIFPTTPANSATQVANLTAQTSLNTTTATAAGAAGAAGGTVAGTTATTAAVVGTVAASSAASIGALAAATTLANNNNTTTLSPTAQ